MNPVIGLQGEPFKKITVNGCVYYLKKVLFS